MSVAAALRVEPEEVVWRPNPGPQTFALLCNAYEIFYGGARGGGKTEWLLMDYAQGIGQGFGVDWRGIIFRRTYKQLQDIITRSHKYFPSIFPGARYREDDYAWIFPDGEALLFRYLERPRDADHYQGHEYPWIGFEELQHWPTDEAFEKIKLCCRSSAPGMPRKIRATGNPLGVGHQWVKARFVDPAPPGVRVRERIAEEILDRVFIPALVWDNPALLVNDPTYVAKLMAIKDPNTRKAWLLGDWDVVAGGFFSYVIDRSKHQIRTWTPPKNWIKYRSFDWGSAHPFSVGWWAISDGTEAPDGKFYPRGAKIRFREWYGCNPKEPNVGIRMPSTKIAQGIIEREKRWGIYGQVHPGPADPQIFKSDDGPSIAQRMAKAGVQWVRADNARIPGWEKMIDLLEGEGQEAPMFYVQDNCVNWWRTVPVLQRDERQWEDVDTEQEDHGADDSRFSVMFKGPYVRGKKKQWK